MYKRGDIVFVKITHEPVCVLKAHEKLAPEFKESYTVRRANITREAGLSYQTMQFDACELEVPGAHVEKKSEDEIDKSRIN